MCYESENVRDARTWSQANDEFGEGKVANSILSIQNMQNDAGRIVSMICFNELACPFCPESSHKLFMQVAAETVEEFGLGEKPKHDVVELPVYFYEGIAATGDGIYFPVKDKTLHLSKFVGLATFTFKPIADIISDKAKTSKAATRLKIREMLEQIAINGKEVKQKDRLLETV